MLLKYNNNSWKMLAWLKGVFRSPYVYTIFFFIVSWSQNLQLQMKNVSFCMLSSVREQSYLLQTYIKVKSYYVVHKFSEKRWFFIDVCCCILHWCLLLYLCICELYLCQHSPRYVSGLPIARWLLSSTGGASLWVRNPGEPHFVVTQSSTSLLLQRSMAGRLMSHPSTASSLKVRLVPDLHNGFCFSISWRYFWTAELTFFVSCFFRRSRSQKVIRPSSQELAFSMR